MESTLKRSWFTALALMMQPMKLNLQALEVEYLGSVHFTESGVQCLSAATARSLRKATRLTKDAQCAMSG